jgi:sialate O-acetylesterase
VGERLAGLALRDCYQHPGLVNSPSYQNFAVEGGKVRLKFSDAEGLRARGGELKGFAIRGDKGEWVWATGKIDGQDILVWDDHISAPTAVRYAWAMNPVISVENGAGLPLLPFRTDTASEQ